MKHEPKSPPWSKGTGTDIGSGVSMPPDRGSASMATAVLPQPKQIRFVNNEGRPPAKRRRVDSACQTCRKRKIRCDGRRPTCSTCQTNRHECLGYLIQTTPGSGSGPSASKSPDIKRRDSGDEIKNEEEDEQDSGNSPLLDSKVKLHASISREDHTRDTSGTQRSSRSTPDLSSGDRDAKSSDEDGEAEPPWKRFVRVPYFRWFGPTAIVKGYKQMIASLPGDHRVKGPTSLSSASPRSLAQSDDGHHKHGPSVRRQSVHSDTRHSDTRPELPFYDEQSPLHPLIKDLVGTFFNHLGRNFPFLCREKVVKMVEDRDLEPILLYVICALAARFSSNSFLLAVYPRTPSYQYGRVFADRAKALVTDTFIYPSVEGAQAMLLLAYEAFGANQDSALWHYEGLAIRMVIDLGLEKMDGIKIPRRPRRNYVVGEPEASETSPSEQGGNSASGDIQWTSDEEKVDTLWAIFALDRYISSGLGRPVTMRMEEFELNLPNLLHATTGLPAPMQALLHIMNMYGKICNILNNINTADDVTDQTTKTISALEGDMHMFYYALDKHLKFSMENFFKYVKHGDGTNFIMLHLWFHTLIILVNCPGVWHDRGRLSNSKIHWALTSAKTIADLASWAQWEECKTGLVMAGNPFTTQPLYIAASLFLFFRKLESKTSIPSSREDSPDKSAAMGKPPARNHESLNLEQKRKEYIAAGKGYTQCYAALQNLETYWAGTKYILTALDQKVKGVTDPEAFTVEEMESTKPKPQPNLKEWMKRGLPIMQVPSPGMASNASQSPKTNRSHSPPPEPSRLTQKRMWALTGTTNSPNSHVTWGIQQAEAPSPAPSHVTTFYDPIRSSLPESVKAANATASYSPYNTTGYQPANQRSPYAPSSQPGSYSGGSGTMHHDAELLIEMRNSPHPPARGIGSFDGGNSAPHTGASPPFFGEHNSYLYVPGPFPAGTWAPPQPQQQWQGGAATGLSYQSTEMDMPTLMQNMDDSTYGLDFLPWTDGGMETLWGHYTDMDEDSRRQMGG